MFRITRNLSSGSFIQCLAKITAAKYCIKLPDDGSLVIRNMLEQILIFCWPCISIYLFININQLDALNFIMFISSLYMFRAHVLVVRRAKLYYTVSGIIKPIGVMILIIKFSASSWLILINKYVGAFLNIFKYFIIVLIVSTNYIFVHLFG